MEYINYHEGCKIKFRLVEPDKSVHIVLYNSDGEYHSYLSLVQLERIVKLLKEDNNNG